VTVTYQILHTNFSLQSHSKKRNFHRCSQSDAPETTVYQTCAPNNVFWSCNILSAVTWR